MKRYAALLVLVSVLLTAMPACGEASVLAWSKEISTQASEALAGADGAVAAFVARGVLTPEQGENYKSSFANLSKAYTPLDAKIQALSKLDAAAALELLPEAEAFAAALANEKIVNLPDNPEVVKWYRTARAVLDTFGARLVARLRSKASGARQSLLELRRDKLDTEADLRRMRELFAA